MWAIRGTLGHSVVELVWSTGLPAIYSAHTISGAVVVLLAAGSAAGSLALARRADDQELLEAGQRVAGVGLSEREVGELLGPANWQSGPDPHHT